MKSLLFTVALLAVSTARGAGFAVDTQSARATGVATAVAAYLDDPSAVFYNPGGLVQGQGLQLQLGDTFIVPFAEAQGPSGIVTESTTGVIPPPHLYATYGVLDNVTLGLGIFFPFGNSTHWPEDWEGREIAIDSKLTSVYLNPVVGLGFLDNRIRLGGGLQVVRATVEITRGLNFVDSTGTVELGGGAWGVGGNVGVQVDLLPKVLSLGLSYRSAVDLTFDGRAHFENVPAELTPRLQDQEVTAGITLPEIGIGGLSYRPFQSLTVAFDANLVGWKRFSELAVQFEDPSLNTTLPKNWEVTFNYHLGAEYLLNDTWTLRAGGVYDPTPAPNETILPDIPDFDRWKVTAGAGYRWRDFQADLGYQFLWLTETTATPIQFPAQYRGTAHVLALTVGYRPELGGSAGK